MARVHAVGYLSIDRIATVGPAGDSVHENVPGGAALYAALGARAAGAAVVLHAVAGEDFAPVWLDAATACGITLAVVNRPGPTRRARMVHAADGARGSTYDAVWWERTAALAPTLPGPVDAGDVVVLAPMPPALAAGVIAAAGAARVVADTSEAFAAAEPAALLALLPRLVAFAPSREETRLLLPGRGDDDAAAALAAQGCAVLQKRGAAGAVAVAGPGAAPEPLPAPAATVVDPTGAGDATVGALAAGLAAGLPFVAACRQALAIGARAVSGIGPAALGLSYGPRRVAMM